MIRTRGRRPLACHHEAGHAMAHWWLGFHSDDDVLLSGHQHRLGVGLEDRRRCAIATGWGMPDRPLDRFLTTRANAECYLCVNATPLKGDAVMDEKQTVEGVNLDLSQLLGFRDLSGLGDDAALIAEELDAAHVKIGEEAGGGGAVR